MNKPQRGRGPGGFTLIEMLVVLCILIILMLFAVPALRTYVRQGKLWDVAFRTKSLMQRARLEVIRWSCPTIVRIVEADETKPARVEGFVDCDTDGVADPDKSDLGSFSLPSGVYLLAPPDREGKDSVGGLSPDPAGGDANVALFQSQYGTVDKIGGFRFGDDRGNFLEVWVEQAATARPEIHKCRLCTDADLRSDWYAQGAGGEQWIWK